MSPRPFALISLLLFTSPLTGKAPAPVAEQVFEADGLVPGTVNGVPMRFKVSPAGASFPLLSQAAATRAGLKGGWLKIGGRIGPVRFKGQTAVGTFTAPGVAQKRRMFWFERSPFPGIDAVLGPKSFPASVVAFRLSAKAASEHIYHLPLVDRGYNGLGSSIILGGEPVLIMWNFEDARSSAVASTGELLAQMQGGRLEGGTFQQHVAFGIERPFRHMRLAKPLVIGPLQLSAINIRDAVAGTAEAGADPDEIIVRAKTKRRKSQLVIALGRDAMTGCSSLSFDKARKEIRLSCR